MTPEKFIQVVAPRIGGNNAIGQLNPVQQGALIEILVRKGIVTREELDQQTGQGFAKLADTIMKMPIPSPLQR